MMDLNEHLQAKTKIIRSQSLKNLEDSIVEKINQAEIQALTYRQRYNEQQRTQQKEEILSENSFQEQHWLNRSHILHECLCDIKRFESEIEI